MESDLTLHSTPTGETPRAGLNPPPSVIALSSLRGGAQASGTADEGIGIRGLMRTVLSILSGSAMVIAKCTGGVPAPAAAPPQASSQQISLTLREGTSWRRRCRPTAAR